MVPLVLKLGVLADRCKVPTRGVAPAEVQVGKASARRALPRNTDGTVARTLRTK